MSVRSHLWKTAVRPSALSALASELGCLHIDVEEHHPRSLARELAHNLLADARAAARHQDNAVLENSDR